jgi:uncharacterized protein (DUF362 family)
MNRRQFLVGSAMVLANFLSGCGIMRGGKKSEKSKVEGEFEKEFEREFEEAEIPTAKPPKRPRVYILKTGNRKEGVEKLMRVFDLKRIEGKSVALKANYNSSDAFPASTHIETLSAIVDVLGSLNAKLLLAERSGMGTTSAVLEERGVMRLADRKGFVIVDLEKHGGWVLHVPEESHWKNGYPFADVFLKADYIVQTCCLKTHRFGGHFTMSLKNSVGMVAKYWKGRDYMRELHRSPDQRKMIAEINLSYNPYIVVMDAIMGFSHGGPERGTLIEPGLMLASNDRVAIDAVGVALLRLYGTTAEVSKGSIFEQEQIARALEIGLSSGEFEIVPLNDGAEEMCTKIEERLAI